uniref:Krueppel-like factor 6 n=1 Tax=Diabrotica virgifera virgifera TaxID=50390 RepID=A0A6P7F2R8_DIAVI
MDILPSVDIFRELQDIHDTGYFSARPSLDDHWQQELSRLNGFRLSISAPIAYFLQQLLS